MPTVETSTRCWLRGLVWASAQAAFRRCCSWREVSTRPPLRTCKHVAHRGCCPRRKLTITGQTPKLMTGGCTCKNSSRACPAVHQTTVACAAVFALAADTRKVHCQATWWYRKVGALYQRKVGVFLAACVCPVPGCVGWHLKSNSHATSHILGTACKLRGELRAAAQHAQSHAAAVHAGSERADLPMLQTRRPST